MKRSVWVLFATSCVLGTLTLVDVGAGPSQPDGYAAEVSGAPSAVLPGSADTSQLWQHLRSAIKQGAYRDALQAAEALLAIQPNDPWVPLYKSLCEERLHAPSPFTQVAPETLSELQRRLEEEARLQKRAAVQQQAIDQALRREQATWDQDLKAMKQQAEHAQRQQRQRVQQEAVEQARAQRRRQVVSRTLEREAAVEQVRAERTLPVAAQPPTTAAPTPAPIEAAPVITTTPAQAVEISPIMVPTTKPEAAATTRGVPPPGAVKISARQMSLSPDRKLAVAQGSAEVLYGNAVLTADQITFFTDTHDAYADGRVRIEDGATVYRGDFIHYNFDTKKGRFLRTTASMPPWHLHGQVVEQIADGVYHVTPGSLTSCEFDPPHFSLAGRQAIVFAGERLARARNVAVLVEKAPLLYLPWFVAADRKSPFFLIPGKRKPWDLYALSGYRYEVPGPFNQQGTVKADWRNNFGWGFGADHQFDSTALGRGLLKVYYNQLGNKEDAALAQQTGTDSRPKGSDEKRYRLLWRHAWQPLPDTTVITDLQKFSDKNFRKDLLFHEEFTDEDAPESFISLVSNAQDYTLTGLLRKRLNRFQSVDETLPQATLDIREQPIGPTRLFSQTKVDVANFNRKRANSELDDDVVRLDWFQQLSYALGWFRPLEVTPRAAVRQTYYTKDIQGSDRQGDRDLFSGQWTAGMDASMKFFRIFQTTSDWLGLHLHLLRHVITPTVSYSYVHEPTVQNSLLTFPSASAPSNALTFGLENKLQTRRPDRSGKLHSTDLARFLISLPYAFRGSGNKSGGRLGQWAFDLETYPWPWMRLEADWKYDPVKPTATTDSRIPSMNLDLVVVGGNEAPSAAEAHSVGAPLVRTYEFEPREGINFLPQGQWYLGLGHRYSHNDKTEDVLQVEWRPTLKWQLGTFQRYTFKEVVGGAKRFNNLREYQYFLRRDLHDWIGELIWRVDREYGEELFVTLTLKAYPQMPLGTSKSYHQPKIGSQNSPFSPLASR